MISATRWRLGNASFFDAFVANDAPFSLARFHEARARREAAGAGQGVGNDEAGGIANLRAQQTAKQASLTKMRSELTTARIAPRTFSLKNPDSNCGLKHAGSPPVSRESTVCSALHPGAQYT